MRHTNRAPAEHLRHALRRDLDGAWTAALVLELNAVGEEPDSEVAPADVHGRRTCLALSGAARVAAHALPALRESVHQWPALQMTQRTEPFTATDPENLPLEVLCAVGWLALDTGLEAEGLAILRALSEWLQDDEAAATCQAEALLILGDLEAAELMLQWEPSEGPLMADIAPVDAPCVLHPFQRQGIGPRGTLRRGREAIAA